MFKTLRNSEIKGKRLFQCLKHLETLKKRKLLFQSFKTVSIAEEHGEILFQCLKHRELLKQIEVLFRCLQYWEILT